MCGRSCRGQIRKWSRYVSFGVNVVDLDCASFLILKDYLLSQEVVDLELYKLLGERTAADNEKPVKKKKEKPAKTEVVLHLIYFILNCRGYIKPCPTFC